VRVFSAQKDDLIDLPDAIPDFPRPRVGQQLLLRGNGHLKRRIWIIRLCQEKIPQFFVMLVIKTNEHIGFRHLFRSLPIHKDEDTGRGREDSQNDADPWEGKSEHSQHVCRGGPDCQ
jgi:hypothetical protein